MEKYIVKTQNSDKDSLLYRFNKREDNAFCEVHNLYFNRLYYFASKKFISTNILAEDVIQDIFVSIWEKKTLKFNTLDHLLGYTYLSIRNRYKDYLIKETRIDKFETYQRMKDDVFFSDMVESETLSILSYAISILPAECAKVFKMHLDGWDIKDIATVLNKSQSTIYNQRNEAINIIKKKISNKALIEILTFFPLT